MNKKCTVYKTVDYLAKRWALLILLEIYKGSPKPKRFSELKKSIPELTPKILSARLKDLQKEGLINRKVETDRYPIKSEYSLTKSGEDFIKIIKEIKRWSLDNKVKNDTCKNRDCKCCDL